MKFHVISLSRLIKTYNAELIASPLPHWRSDYSKWKVALGWWLSQHSRTQMDTLLAAKLADGRTLLETTEPGQQVHQSEECTASASGGKH